MLIKCVCKQRHSTHLYNRRGTCQTEQTISSSTSSSRYCPAKSSSTAAVNQTRRPITVQHRKPRPFPMHAYFPQISLLCLLLFSRTETLSLFFFKVTHLFEAWIIFIFLPRVLLFVVLMFAPCKHVNFNSDNKTWWFCLCCGSSFDGGCLGKRRDHLWCRVFHGNTLLSKERWRSDRTHKDTLNLLMRP